MPSNLVRPCGRREPRSLLAILTTALAATVVCSAAHAAAPIHMEARSSSLAQASPHGLDSAATVQNGVLLTNRASPNGSASAGPLGADVTTAFANTSQIDGGLLTDSATQADLGKGNHSILINAPGALGAGASLGFGFTRWIEKVTFHNTNDTPVELAFTLDTTGQTTDTSGPTGGSIDIKASVEVQIVNDANWKDVHLKGGPAFYMGGCQYNYSKQFGSYFSFQPAGNNDQNVWITTETGPASGRVQATLVLPPGVVSITIDSLFSIDARTGAVCDYTDGCNFAFGDLPAGLTWTSQSGVFLRSTPGGSLDSDNDGTPNVSDQCPTDPNKTASGSCGCGVPEVDTDSDGICDGVDNCPNAANADQADTDSDGVGDACDVPDNENTNAGGNANENGGNANENGADNANANAGGSNSNKNSGDGTTSDPPISACAAPMMPLALMPLLALSRRRGSRRPPAGGIGNGG